MSKRKWDSPRIAILLVILFLGLLSTIFGVVLASEYLIVYETDAKLEVEEAYFEESSEANGETELDVFVLITNVGDKECDSHLRAFIINKETNIAMDDATTADVRIEGQTTDEAHFSMMVPSNARYRVELLVFKDDMISVKGEGHVDLVQGGAGGRDYWTEDEDDAEEKASLATPFVGPAAIIAVICVSAIIFRRWRK